MAYRETYREYTETVYSQHKRDEIEKGLSGTKSSNFSDGGTTARVFSTFLNWLQDKEKPVFVIATANDLTQLPSELLRKGRFDDIFFVDLPEEEERKEIFKLVLEKNKRDSSKFDLDYLASSSKGFSGAEIEQSILDSMFETFSTFKGRSDISNVSIIKSLKSMVPLSKTKEDNINKIREEASKIAKSAN